MKYFVLRNKASGQKCLLIKLYRMKTTAKALFVFILFMASAATAFPIAYSSEQGQKRNVRDYESIEVSTGIETIVSMGDEETVRVEADEDIIDDVITEVKNGTLRIYVKNRTGFNFFNWRDYSSVKVYVQATTLNRIKASAGANVRTETTLNGEAIDVDASSGGHVRATLVYKNVNLGASSGGQMKVEGQAKYLEAGSSSGGIINAEDLNAEYCKANASSGGNTSVSAKTEFTARASSGGNIRYSGNPETKNINSSSGGSIYQR